ncbi:hypothetical protein [Streptomyces sp. NPDC055006]
MKVRLTYTVDVNPEKWMDSYGVAKDDVREDVRAYMRNLIQQCAAAEESDLEVID